MNTRNPYLLLLFIGFLLTGCTGKTVTTNRSKASTEINQLRVMSYNIHIANPPGQKGVYDLEAIARVIRNEKPDLVALQEVDVRTNRSGKVNQAEALAGLLNMHYFFARAIDYDGGEYGVAILSRFPLSDTRLVPLPEDAEPKAEDRVLAMASVRLPNGQFIRFGSTHLDVMNAENRLQQVQTINAIVTQDTLPFIVGGDFNDLPASKAIAELDKVFNRTCQVDCEPTYPQDLPVRAIDFIAISKSSSWSVQSHRVVPERYASDHLPIVATLGF